MRSHAHLYVHVTARRVSKVPIFHDFAKLVITVAIVFKYKINLITLCIDIDIDLSPDSIIFLESSILGRLLCAN